MSTIAAAPSSRPARFITFEGIDGAGKTTHIQALVESLQQAGHTVLQTREPGGTPVAETLRELVLHQPMDGLTEALLVFAARRDHLQRVIIPALERGETVVCDRFTDATFAYQGGGRGGDWSLLEQLEAWVQQGRQPDLTFLFDLPSAEAAQRRAAVRRPDRFEAQDTLFFERVRAAYEQRRAADPGRFELIDARAAPEAVWAQVNAAARGRRLW
jgi:dTMP kinase